MTRQMPNKNANFFRGHYAQIFVLGVLILCAHVCVFGRFSIFLRPKTLARLPLTLTS